MSLKQTARMAARNAYKTWTLKALYPNAYRKAAAAAPINPKKVVFLEVREKKLTDSFRQVYEALEKRGGYELVTVCLEEGTTNRKKVRSNCVAAAKELADASWIFVNDSCYFLSSLSLRPQTKVIQLWHACGAFKRFGYSLGGRKFGASEKELNRFPVHRNFTYVTVSSPEVVWAYAEAFRMDEKRIVPTGISRTDIFYDDRKIAEAQSKVRTLLEKKGAGEVPSSKKILLYAPTFRGRVADAVSPDVLDFEKLHKALGDDWIFVCKHHPFVKKRPQIREACRTYTFDVTEDLSIEELLMVSDVCISDYSSLVFEYALFERPMLFLAYDLEDYGDWRGFYYPFEEMTPGPVVRTTEEVIDYLQHLDERFDKKQVQVFRQRFMSSCDGHATERILALMEPDPCEQHRQ